MGAQIRKHDSEKNVIPYLKFYNWLVYTSDHVHSVIYYSSDTNFNIIF